MCVGVCVRVSLFVCVGVRACLCGRAVCLRLSLSVYFSVSLPEKKKVCVVFLRCAGEADERLPLGKSVQLCAYLLFVGALAARLSDG